MSATGPSPEPAAAETGSALPGQGDQAVRDAHRASVRSTAEGMGGNAFADFIGLRHDGPGVTRLQIRPELLNGGGLLLGPVGFALVDYSMGSLVWSHRNPGERIATIGISLNYISSAGEGEVSCRTTLDRRNRHIAVLSSEVHHEDGRRLISAIGSFSIYTPRTRAPQTGPDQGERPPA